jgi:hypothetical protein
MRRFPATHERRENTRMPDEQSPRRLVSAACRNILFGQKATKTAKGFVTRETREFTPNNPEKKLIRAA